jgi:hypothetical protein
MKKALLTFFIIAIVKFCFAQTISPEVIASDGEHFVGTNAQLSWTIGEVMTETYSSGSNQLTQGFHQTNLTSTLIKNIDQGFELSVFPNPVSEQLIIKSGETSKAYFFNIFDNKGKLILTKPSQSNNSQIIDVSHFSTGIYFLNVIDSESKTIKCFKINKIK